MNEPTNTISSELFKNAVEQAFDHIFITDKEGTIIYVNHVGEKMTGYTKEEIIGHKPSLWGGVMPQNFYKELWKTILIEKKNFSYEITNRRKNGSTYIAQMHLSPIIDSKGNVRFFLAIERDITREKEIDKAKTEFISFLSHQFRGPLSVINMSAEMLLDPTMNMTDEQKEYIREIHDSNHKLTDLVNNLLDISKIEGGTFSIEAHETDIEKMIEDIMHEQYHIAKEKNIHFQFISHLKDSVLNIDEKLTRIVIQNIISNALKYTPTKGKVTIEVQQHCTQSKKMSIKNGILVTIKDNGYGIPVHEQKNIFTKLYRAKNIKNMKVEGTGLGLYIVKTIIDKMGGTIWFTSKVHAGTTFFILLPNIKDSAKKIK
ncbi:MAG: ATP-binding protein [Candidatus Paceibacterota bacterium]|jgi:PAS domain S-box-containing protein